MAPYLQGSVHAIINSKVHRVPFTYRFHLQQVHLLLSQGVLELQLLIHFEQQRAKACGDNPGIVKN